MTYSGCIGQEIHAGADVFLARLGDELHRERVATGGDAVGAAIVGSVYRTVLGTGHGVRAQSCVPSITGVAVRVAGSRVGPTPGGS